MKKKKQKVIGLVLDFFSSELLEGVRSYAEEHDLLLDARWSVRGDWTPQDPEWDGVIYSIVDDPKLRKRIGRWKTPQVSLIDDGADWTVVPDFRECGRMAAQEFAEADRNELLNIIISSRAMNTEFGLSVSEMAQQMNLKCKNRTYDIVNLSTLIETLKNEVTSSSLPIALLNPHAGVMFGLESKLLEEGIRIPEDVAIAVIEKDVQQTHDWAPIPLTGVALNEWLRGFVAAEVLHKLLENDQPLQNRVLIPPKGVTRRASTGHAEIPDRIVAATLSYLRKNHLKPISVSDIVNHVNASRRTVENRFKSVMNRGLHEELSRLRIEEAKRQLARSDDNITTIAEQCGFSSLHYFSSAFKRVAGVSPKVYQKQNKII